MGIKIPINHAETPSSEAQFAPVRIQGRLRGAAQTSRDGRLGVTSMPYVTVPVPFACPPYFVCRQVWEDSNKYFSDRVFVAHSRPSARLHFGS